MDFTSLFGSMGGGMGGGGGGAGKTQSSASSTSEIGASSGGNINDFSKLGPWLIGGLALLGLLLVGAVYLARK